MWSFCGQSESESAKNPVISTLTTLHTPHALSGDRRQHMDVAVFAIKYIYSLTYCTVHYQ